MSEEATQSSLPAVGFSIATDESSTDNEGEEHKRVESLWNDRLRFAVFYLTYSAGGQSGDDNYVSTKMYEQPYLIHRCVNVTASRPHHADSDCKLAVKGVEVLNVPLFQQSSRPQSFAYNISRSQG